MMINEIRRYCTDIFNKGYRELGIFVVRFDGKEGIVRCKHVEKDNVIKLLRSIKNIYSKDVEVETVGASGTIKSLRAKHMST